MTQLPPGIRAIVDDIEARDDGRIAPASLAWALRRPVQFDDVVPFIRFDAENYRRNLVQKTDRWELRLLCWKPRQCSSIHGHGGSACAFRIVRGSATETVVGARDRVWTPGAIVEETSEELIHQVGNNADDPLVTLHAYSPPLPVDAPSPRAGRSIVIVGAGFAGTALAYHLLKQGGSDLRVLLVERGPWLGRGVAYGVESSLFRLNVPAARMSLDPNMPDDFVQWASVTDRPHAFLSRARFGDYVVDRLSSAIRRCPGKLRLRRLEAVAIERDGVRASNSELLAGETVVLASGLAPRIAPEWMAADARIIDAWDECGLATLPHDGRVLILGAGLSAIDVVSLLATRNVRGSLVVLSRNGLLPRPHLEPHSAARALSADLVHDAPRSLRALLRWVRGVIAAAERRGEPWQHAIDSLRPHIPALWRGLPPEHRARFARSIRPYWDVLRHRAPADALALVERLRGEGRLELLAAQVLRCEPSASHLDVDIRLRGGAKRRDRFDAIVRCIGPALQHSEMETPLIRSLLEAGLAVRDPSGLGIVTGEDGALVDANGRASSTHFALGAHRRAATWETTSVPDISVQAQALARRLLAQSI